MSSPEQGNKTLVISLKPCLDFFFLVGGKGWGGVRGEREKKSNVQFFFYFVSS